MPPRDHSQPVFQGTRFDIYRVLLDQRSGGTHMREVVVPANAVVILPMLDADTVVLIRNERFAVGETLLELPAGTLEQGEDPLLAAGRELAEETGYTSSKISKLITFYPTPGFCTESMTAYLAEDLTPGPQSLDETERITVEATPFDEAIKMVKDGHIVDGKTIAVVPYYRTFLQDP